MISRSLRPKLTELIVNIAWLASSLASAPAVCDWPFALPC